MRPVRAILLPVLCLSAALGLAGCGADPPAERTSATQPAGGAVAPGGGLTVAEAISTDAEPPLAVSGWIVGSDDGARLCSGYDPGASEPCIEPSLALVTASPGASGTQVSVLGAVEGDSFVVDSLVQG